MGKIKEHEGKKIIVEDYILDKVLDKNKEVTGIEQFDDAKTFIDADNKLIRIEKKWNKTLFSINEKWFKQ